MTTTLRPPSGVTPSKRLGLLCSARYDRIATGLVKDWPRLMAARAPLKGWEKVAPTDVAFTETGRLDNAAARDRLMGDTRWSNYRPNIAGTIAEEDLTLAWADAGWDLLEVGTWELSQLTYYKKGSGEPYDPFRINWVVVRDRETGVVVIKAAMHLPTQAATDLRLKVWKDCGRGFTRWCVAMTQKWPGAFKDVRADWNAGWKRRAHQALLLEHYGKPSGLTFAWASAGIGTKAAKSRSTLIDGWLTDLPVVDVDHLGGSWSYNDVAQSVHPPQWCAYLLWTGATPRPVVPAKPQPPKAVSPGWDAIVDAVILTRSTTPANAPTRRRFLATIEKLATPFSVKYRGK